MAGIACISLHFGWATLAKGLDLILCVNDNLRKETLDAILYFKVFAALRFNLTKEAINRLRNAGQGLSIDHASGGLCHRHHDDVIDIDMRRACGAEQHHIGDILSGQWPDAIIDFLRAFRVAVEAHNAELSLDQTRVD